MEKPIETEVPERPTGTNFIRAIVDEDVRAGRYERIVTRFPPEPNGYLHIGHAKAIVLNFGIARDFDGICNLRFDDTNPETEDIEYVESIQRDVRWLGYDWDARCYYASDYFEKLYAFAEELIRKGLAYVDSQSEEEIRAGRGTVTEPGKLSPYRERSVEENLDLFRRMRAGEFPDGAHVLRAKGDMASTNMKMRDPLLYRIRHAHHYRTGDDWCIYPMYDYAHPLSDAIEGISHSLCTLEFDNNREVYDWVLDSLFPEPRPHQHEFARFALDYTIVSKRKLLELVKGGYVRGWDDPRMPTLAALRRRGVTPEAIRDLMERVGVAKVNSRTDIAMFEHAIRDDLNFRAPRVMCVLRPLKVVIENFPEGRTDWLDASYWPHDVPKEGTRKVPFTRELYIEQDDFMENPPRRYYRLSPGQEVRLRYGYLITCREVVKDAAGNVVELRCTYDPDSRGGNAPDGRVVRGTIHWVSAAHAVPCEVRLYDRLFKVPDPESGEGSFLDNLNP
ncbi:MAG TPA: glutamine--tRNA ligase/YqeY domain fusion protein, partial [Rhodothermales bacterium]